MVVFPNCKINLGLRIVRKREDGFHDLETVFQPVALWDVLEIVGSSESGVRSQESGVDTERQSKRRESALSVSRSAGSRESGDVLFSTSGIGVDEAKDNLCVRAYQLLKKDFPQLPAVSMHLHKAIPIGAGLGGGSADAAFTLKLIHQQFNLGLSSSQLAAYALQLGSDCPFFLVNQTCFATGRGEKLEPLSLDLSGYKFLIVNPGIHISTAQAFSGITPSTPPRSIKEIVKQPIDSWKNELVNDFEKTIFRQYPEIEAIKTKCYELGAVYASMSGSGSTVFGIFEKSKQLSNPFPAGCFYKEITQRQV